MIPPAAPAPPIIHYNHPPLGHTHHEPHIVSPPESPLIEVLPPGVARFDDADDIITRMDNMRLNARNTEKGKPFTELEKPLKKALPPLDASATTAFLAGWTFFRADPENDSEKPSWSRALKRKMNLSQAELGKMVQKRKKKFTPAEQYGALKKLRRSHVDRLIEESEKEDSRFYWTCVYVDSNEKYVKGKGSRRGDYETISMDIIIQRKIRAEHAAEASSVLDKKTAFGELVDLNLPLKPQNSKNNKRSEPEPQGVKGINMPANRPLPQGPYPPYIGHPVSQPYPHPIGQPGPIIGNGHLPGPVPLHPQPLPPHMMNGPFNNHAGHRGVNEIEVIGEEIQFPPRHSPGHGPELIHGFHDKGSRDFVHVQNRHPHHPQGSGQAFQPQQRTKSPGNRRSPQDTPSSSSAEDDDSSLFDKDADSSTTEDLYHDAVESAPARGSLHQGRRSSRRRRERSAYRLHYRKPIKSMGDRRNVYSTGPVELFPENSLHATRREPPIRRLTDVVDRTRPRIMYEDHLDPSLPTAAEITYLSEKFRERERERDRDQELRNRANLDQLRSRIIDVEENLRRREQEVSLREREARNSRILDREPYDSHLLDHGSHLLGRNSRLLDRDSCLPLERDPRLLERDPRLLERDPRLLERDPRPLERDPRLLERDPRLLERDHRLLDRESRLPLGRDSRVPLDRQYSPTRYGLHYDSRSPPHY